MGFSFSVPSLGEGWGGASIVAPQAAATLTELRFPSPGLRAKHATLGKHPTNLATLQELRLAVGVILNLMVFTNLFLPIILLRVTPTANRNTYSVATLIIHIPRVEALYASTLGYEIATPTELPGVRTIQQQAPSQHRGPIPVFPKGKKRCPNSLKLSRIVLPPLGEGWGGAFRRVWGGAFRRVWGGVSNNQLFLYRQRRTF